MNGIFFLSYTILDDSRDDLVRYNLAILSPVLLVLVGASGVIPPRTIKQEQREVERVEIRDHVVFLHRNAPEDRRKNLRDVVDVAAKAPPTAGEE